MVKVKPLVKMTVDVEDAVLEWLTITRYNEPAGELLAAFELIRVSNNLLMKQLGYTLLPDNLLMSLIMTESNC